MMRLFLIVASLAVSTAAVAGPVNISAEENERQARALDQLTKSVATESSDAVKFALITRAMKEERDVDVRGRFLDLALKTPGPDLESFLTALLDAEPDAGLRGRAATALGHLGSEKSLAALANCAANDRTSDVQIGCMVGRSSARRAATFAVAELAARRPTIARDAAAKLRDLPAATNAKDNEGLGDARIQALFQVTHDDELLKPFFERLKSKDEGERASGVVAFEYLNLNKAPPEVVAALKDDSPNVQSWARWFSGRSATRTRASLSWRSPGTRRRTWASAATPSALGRMKFKEASDLMEKLLADKDQRVVVNAAIALHQITGKKVKRFPEGYKDD